MAPTSAKPSAHAMTPDETARLVEELGRLIGTMPQGDRLLYISIDFRDEVVAALTAAVQQQKALRALVAALDACVPAIKNQALLAHVHGARYDGPTFGKELEAARAALQSPASPRSEGEKK